MSIFSFNGLNSNQDFIIKQNIKGLTFEKDNCYFYLSGAPIICVNNCYQDFTENINWGNLKFIISNSPSLSN